MEKFKAMSPSVQVNGETILAFVNGVPSSKDAKLVILKKYGIFDPKSGQWYSQQAWLDAFRDISEKVGPVTLRLIGKAIPENAKFPLKIKDTKQAFELLDSAYKSNHRGGEIGYYKMISYNAVKKTLQMECNTPYPEDFDEGILIGLFEKFKPVGLTRQPIVKKEKINTGIVYTLSW